MVPGWMSRRELMLAAAGALAGILWFILSWYWFVSIAIFAVLSFVIFRRVEHGLYITLFAFPIDLTQLRLQLDEPSYMFILNPYIVPLVMTLCSYAVHMAMGLRRPRIEGPVHMPLLLMVMYLLVSISWSPKLHNAMALGGLLVAHYLFFLLVVVMAHDEDHMRKMTNIMIAVGYMTSIGVITSQWYEYKDMVIVNDYLSFVLNFGEVTDRPSGFGNTNNMAGYLVLMSFLVFGRLIAEKRRRGVRNFYLVTLALFIVSVLVTASRGALIGLLSGGAIFLLAHPVLRVKAIRNTAIALILLFGIILVAKPAFIDRMLMGFGYTGTLIFTDLSTVAEDKAAEQTGNISGMEQRWNWWVAGFNEMRNNPLKLIFGLGLGGFISYAEAIGTHSVLLSFFFDMGAVGIFWLICITLALLPVFAGHIRSGRTDAASIWFLAVIAAFVAEICIHGLIDYEFYSYTARMFWFPLAYTVAATGVYEKRGLTGEKIE